MIFKFIFLSKFMNKNLATEVLRILLLPMFIFFEIKFFIINVLFIVIFLLILSMSKAFTNILHALIHIFY